VTYAECAAEGEKFAQSLPQQKRRFAKEVITALAQCQAGLTVIEHCPKCQSLIEIRALSDSVWKSSCECGGCNSTFRGL
jgi:hypothetical protein